MSGAYGGCREAVIIHREAKEGCTESARRGEGSQPYRPLGKSVPEAKDGAQVLRQEDAWPERRPV